jgi:chromosomal replication initiation ATPase DnaA
LNLSKEVESFCGRWFRNDKTKPLLILIGESNCAKTHCAKAVFHFAMNMAQSSFSTRKDSLHVPDYGMFRWPEVVDGFKGGDYSVTEDLFNLDLAILDDVGAEHDPSKMATNKLCQIMSRREKKHTLITTNIKTEDWANAFDLRVADRFLRNSVIVDLTGLESYALRKV